MKTLYKLAITFAFGFLLIGCSGGGGGGAPGAAISTSKTGTFQDSFVVGLTYTSASHSGSTDSSGNFTYEPGETITFKIGDITLGSVIAGPTVTPLNFVTGSTNRQMHVNMLRLLQSIDSDNDATNGIDIPLNTGNGDTINFDQSATDFAADADVVAFIAANTNTNTLVTEQDAVTHFNTTLVNLTDPTEIMNFTGSTWVEQTRTINTNTNCTSPYVTLATYTNFGASSLQETIISESWDTSCVFNGSLATTTSTVTYASIASDIWNKCGTSCTYADLNKSFIGVDADSRTVETFTSHNPGSNKIYTYKRIISGSGAGIIYESVITKQ